jgi:L-2-hydroxyglutarate oxidase
MEHHDVAVIGGGIIGLSTAAAISRVAAGAAVVVLERRTGWPPIRPGATAG